MTVSAMGNGWLDEERETSARARRELSVIEEREASAVLLEEDRGDDGPPDVERMVDSQPLVDGGEANSPDQETVSELEHGRVEVEDEEGSSGVDRESERTGDLA